jgi:hypothetical protein
MMMMMIIIIIIIIIITKDLKSETESEIVAAQDQALQTIIQKILEHHTRKP